MALIPRPVAGKKKSQVICDAFVAGAPQHAEGVVFFGVDASNLREWNRVRRNGVPYWYIDNSYFDCVRGQQFRVTQNRMQLGDVLTRTSDGERFKALGLGVKPLQSNPQGHWVVIEQSPSFMQLVGAPEWFNNTLVWARDSGRHVLVRTWSADKIRAQATLPVDLRGAWGLLAHSSAAAVTALLEGIPALVDPASAVAHLRLSTDNSVDGRLRLMNVLADNQFTLEEMRTGVAWRWLNRK